MKRDAFTLSLDLGQELVIDNFAGGGGASTGIALGLGRDVDIAINHDGEALAMHAANHPTAQHFREDVFAVHPGFVTHQLPIGLAWFSPDCKHFSKAKGAKPVEKKIRGLAWVTLKWGTFQMPRMIMLENVEEFQDWGPLGADNKPIKAEKGRTFKAFVDALSTGLPLNHPDLPEIYDALGHDFPIERLHAGLGYKVEWKVLRACDFGTPTIRKRLILIARRDGRAIVWPAPTHGNPKQDGVKQGKLLPWRTAAECIDWSIPCPSIFERKKPLKPATCRRIAKGIMKFVVNSADPFIVPLTHHGADRMHDINDALPTVTAAHRGEFALVSAHVTKFRTGSTGSAADEPLHTITAGGDSARPAGAPHALGIVTATMIQTGYGEREGQAPRVPGIDKPMGTLVGTGKHAAVTAFLAKHYTGVVGTAVDKPAGTVTSVDHHSCVTANLIHLGHGEGKDGTKRFSHGIRDVMDPLNTVTATGAPAGIVTSHMVKLRNNQFGQECDEPAPTLTADGGHLGEVSAFLIKYYTEGGTDQDLRDPMHTIPTKDRLGLVTIKGEDYAIVDIGMRMLTPRELARAQGFPDSYILDPEYEKTCKRTGKKITRRLSKSSQVRMIGNSVCPPLAAAIVAANFTHEQALVRAA